MVITWFLSGLARKVITTVLVWSSGGWEGEHLPTGGAAVQFVGVLESQHSLLQSHDLQQLRYNH